MSRETQELAEETPRQAYQRRLQARIEEAQTLERSELAIIRGRVFAFGLGALVAWLAWSYDYRWSFLLLLPLAVFLVIVVRHRRLRQQIHRLRRAARHYRRALNRLDGKWHGVGADGLDFMQKEHLYAADLDLFGAGSIFQRMCAAVTRQGEDELARWLSQPASAEEIAKRHGALRELRDKLDLRERLGVLDVGVHDRLDPHALRDWSTSPADSVLLDDRRRLIAALLSGLALAGVAVWIYLGSALPFFVMLGFAAAFLALMKEPLKKQLDEMQAALGNLDQLVNVLKIVERLEFQHPYLREISALWHADGHLPSQQIDRLHRVVEQYEGFQRNQMLIPISLTLLLPVHFARSIESWRDRVGSHIPDWLDAVGRLEALASLSRYWFERTHDVLPEIAEQGPLFTARQIGHPLIPHDQCVRNDVQLDQSRRMMMVSGSNMSGKSTMLRAIGVNAVLAQAGAPVCASFLRVSPLAVGTSMRISDSLLSGTSHFYAELRRLKSIVDLTGQNRSVLFLLDEVLHGTNSKDRRLGAEAVLKRLLSQRAIGLVTTHDLALTEIVEKLDGAAVNVHFADHFEGDKMVFDYKMQTGVVKKSNALELMRSLGLDI